MNAWLDGTLLSPVPKSGICCEYGYLDLRVPVDFSVTQSAEFGSIEGRCVLPLMFRHGPMDLASHMLR